MQQRYLCWTHILSDTTLPYISSRLAWLSRWWGLKAVDQAVLIYQHLLGDAQQLKASKLRGWGPDASSRHGQSQI